MRRRQEEWLDRLGIGEREGDLQALSITAAADQIRRRVLRRVVVIAALMLLVAGGGLFAWMDTSWRSVKTELQERMLTALAEAAAPMTLLFTEVDRVLGEIALKRSSTATEGSWLSMPDGQGAILGPDARPTGTSAPSVLPPRPQLLALIESAAQSGKMQLSLPYRMGYDWFATAVRQLDDGSGGFAVLTFSINAVLNDWSQPSMQSDASFALLTESGQVWLRHPFAANLVGADASKGPLYQAMRYAGTAQGIATIGPGEDGEAAGGGERMVGWRQVQLFGLTIVAGQAMESVTALWRERYGWLFVVAGVLTLAVVGATLLVGRTLAREAARRETAMRLVEASEERFRDIADAASDWFWEMDADGRLSYVSDRVRDVSSLDPAWFKGRSFAELVDGANDPEHAGLFLADLEERRPFREFIFRMDLGRGRFRWIKTSGKPLFDDEERFLGYRGTASDITLAREAEGRAAAAQLRLLRAIETVSEAFALFDKGARLIMCNERFRSLHMPGDEAKVQPGMTYREFLELIGRSGRVSLDGLSLDAWLERRERLRAAGESVEQRMADGSWYRVSENRTPEGDCIVVFSDVTAFKRREAQLIDLADRSA